MTLWDEIESQPEVLGDFLDHRWDEVLAIARWLTAVDYSYAVIAARGSSDNAARYAQYLWGAHNQLSVALAAPSLYTLLDSPPSLRGALVVGISQSGESPDLLAVLRSGRDQGRPTLAVTNAPTSPMAGIAERHLDLGAGPELAVAATKSYTCQLLALAALSVAMAADPVLEEALHALPGAVAGMLEEPRRTDHAVSALQMGDRCVVIGRGYNHSTAFEWALKITELTYVAAQAFSAADFRHGPIALTEPSLAVLAVATDGPVYADVAELLTDVRRRGAVVVAITDREDCPCD
ncbi:MAG: SIS domain-containing protein, partial [Actinobacteria bacterium]|nr:SIS domain-containing protein [Actinomycetota bacterium]